MQKDPYARLAGRYDRGVEPSASLLRRKGLAMLHPRENQKILDVGCGTGTQLALYARPGCTLTGIDVSPAMLEEARGKLGETADLRREDGTRMSFADATFDVVMLALTLHEMAPDVRPRVLSECRRVTKPGGAILAIDFHYGPYPFPKGWIGKMFITLMEMGGGREHFRHYRNFMKTRGLDGLVQGAGIPVRQRFVAEQGIAAIYLLSP